MNHIAPLKDETLLKNHLNFLISYMNHNKINFFKTKWKYTNYHHYFPEKISYSTSKVRVTLAVFRHLIGNCRYGPPPIQPIMAINFSGSKSKIIRTREIDNHNWQCWRWTALIIHNHTTENGPCNPGLKLKTGHAKLAYRVNQILSIGLNCFVNSKTPKANNTQ